MGTITPQYVDVNKLSSLGIYELRNIARAFGVARPTTLVRRDLVNAIVDVVNGNSVASHSGRGRPPRDLTFDITRVLEDESSAYSVFNVVEEPPCVRSTTSGEVRIISGFFHMVPHSNNGVVISQELFTYFVPLKLISSYSLATGDYLEVRAVYNPARGSFSVEEITLINGIGAVKYASAPAVRFEKRESVRPQVVKQLGDVKFKLGQRVLVSTSKEFDRIGDIAVLAKGITDCAKIALVIEENDDCVKYLLDNGVDEVFLAKPESNYKRHVLLCLTAMFTAKRRAENGEQVVIFVDNLTKLFKAYNNSSATDGQMPVAKVNIGAMTDAKIFFMAARALASGGSLTVVGYANGGSGTNDEFILNEFADSANVIIPKQ